MAFQDVDQLIDQWHQAKAKGTSISPEELCRDAPELLDAVRRGIAEVQHADGVMGDSHPVWDSDTTGPYEPVAVIAGAGAASDDLLFAETTIPQRQIGPAAPPPPVPPSHGNGNRNGNGRGHGLNGGNGGLPKRMGRFEILGELGQGGFGVVYDARDPIMRRRVAIKEVRHDRASDEAAAQFQRERRIAGQLEHPGIVPVHEPGEEQGRQFFAMRRIPYLEGNSFDKKIEDFHKRRETNRWHSLSLEFARLLRQFIIICETVHYAHDKKRVIHRDIKPKNILVGEHGEVLVTDWGNAERLPREGKPKSRATIANTVTELTTDHIPGKALSVTGTYGYMSPEQITGDPAALSPASDIYSLGATLYQVLTGQHPFHGCKSLVHAEYVAKTVTADYPPPCRVNPDVPKALEAVCLKAMSLKPQDRFPAVPQRKNPKKNADAVEAPVPSAAELAREVERWLTDKPLNCYQEPRIERLWRWCNRHRSKVGMAAMAAALLTTIVVSVLAVTSYATSAAALKSQGEVDKARADESDARRILSDKEREAETARADASSAREAAAESANKLLSQQNAQSKREAELADERKKIADERRRRNEAVNLVGLSFAAWNSGDPKIARDRLLESKPLNAANWEYRWLDQLYSSAEFTTAFRANLDNLFFNGFRFDSGRYVLDAVGTDPQNQGRRRSLRFDIGANGPSATAYGDLFESAAPALAESGRIPSSAPSMTDYAPIPQSECRFIRPDHSNPRVQYACITADRVTIHCGSPDLSKVIINRKSVNNSECSLGRTAKFSARGEKLALVSGSTDILVYDIADPKNPILTNRLIGHVNDVREMKFSDDARLLASSETQSRVIVENQLCDGRQPMIHVWKLAEAGEERPNSPGIGSGKKEPIDGISPDGRQVARAGQQDKRLQLFNRGRVDAEFTWDTASRPLVVRFSTDGQTMYVGRPDGEIKKWRRSNSPRPDWQRETERTIFASAIRDMVLNDKEDSLAVLTNDNRWAVLSASDLSSRKFGVANHRASERGSLAFHKNGGLSLLSIETTFNDSAPSVPVEVTVLDWQKTDVVYSSSVFPRQRPRRSTTSDSDPWIPGNATTQSNYSPSLAAPLSAARAKARSEQLKLPRAAVSPDGAWLVVADADGAIRPVKTTLGGNEKLPAMEQLEISAHTSGCTALAFLNDGVSFVTAGRDGSVKLWRLHTYQTIAPSPTTDDKAAANVAAQSKTQIDGEIVEILRLKPADGDTVERLSFSSDGDTLVGQCQSSYWVWDATGSVSR